MKTTVCIECGNKVPVTDEGFIATHDVSETTLEVCKMSGEIHTPGPNDWGVKYSPSHQRDPSDPSKPLAR